MPVSEGRQEENWKAVEAAIRQQEGAPVRVMRPVQWGKVFAAAACLMTLAFGIWYIGARTGPPQIAEIKTGYGEIKNVLLPNSSVVILNVNSSIRIAQQWTEKEGRQRWRGAEGHFPLPKKAGGRCGWKVRRSSGWRKSLLRVSHSPFMPGR